MRKRSRCAQAIFSVIVLAVIPLMTASGSGGAPGAATARFVRSLSSRPRAGGTLLLAAQDDLSTLDNSQAVSPIDYEMTAGALYAGLYEIDHAGKLNPSSPTGCLRSRVTALRTQSPSDTVRCSQVLDLLHEK